MNENFKEKLNIGIRCLIYILLVTSFSPVKETTTIPGDILVLKLILDTYIFAAFIGLFHGNEFDIETDLSKDTWDTLLTISTISNFILFLYIYAKICGLYKKLKKYNFWCKSLIFLIISFLAYLISIYDFKNLKRIETDLEIELQFYIISILFAFLLNIFFDFLTKKFPKPFEKIGYICSIEFFKDIIGKIKILKK
ncbi:hypothetical protein IJX73_01030 [bacterium]|nr:hypothetical protein [bacterium]